MFRKPQPQPQDYDVTERYRAEVRPLVDALIEKLDELNIPFLYLAQIANDDEGSTHNGVVHIDSDLRPIGTKMRVVGETAAANTLDDLKLVVEKYANRFFIEDFAKNYRSLQ